MARPVNLTDDNRSERLAVRLTASELAAFNKRAEDAGLSRADFARRAVLLNRVTVNRTAQADPAVVAQLIKIGTNLNQLTRTANGLGVLPPDLDRLCQKIDGIVMKAIEPEPV